MTTASFNNTFYRYYPEVLYFTMKMIHDRPAAEDITLKAFVSLWKKLKDITPGSERAYLYICAKTKALNYLRAKAFWEGRLKGYSPETVTAPSDDLMSHIILYMHREISRLPPQRRDIVKLKLQGYSAPQIAKIMGLKRLTVRNQLRLAYKTLRVMLEPVRGSI